MIGIGPKDMVERTKNKLNKLGILEGARNTNLANVDLTGCTFYQHDFTHANLKGADFTGSIFTECKFDNANIVTAKFIDCLIENCSFQKTQGNGVIFKSARFQVKCDFTGSELSSLYEPHKGIIAETTFEAAQSLTSRLDFRDCNMLGVNLDDTLLVEVNFSGAKISDKESLDKNGGAFILESNLFRANMQRVTMQNMSMGRCRLELADLSNSNLSGLSLATMTLWGTNFNHCKLSGMQVTNDVILGNAIMHFCNLADADLSRAISLETAQLEGSTYNKNTKFPPAFEPAKHGLKLK